MMFVYLLHFDRKISPEHTCQHYIGYSEHFIARLNDHRSGNGARLTQVSNERQIGYNVVRLWYGDRLFERKLKNRKNSPKLCPICNEHCQGQFDNEIEFNIVL